jgi:tetratricopeptide (TPR) repeat protein
VKKQEWRKALSSYERGLAYTQYLYTKDESVEKQKRELVTLLFLNKALACIKLNQYGDAFRSCDEALKLDNKCGKAYYRRALCFEMKGEYENAKKDLLMSMKYNPNDGGIREELEKVKVLVQKQEEKEKKKYSNLFEKLKKIEDEEDKEKKEEAKKKKKEEKELEKEEEKLLEKEEKELEKEEKELEKEEEEKKKEEKELEKEEEEKKEGEEKKKKGEEGEKRENEEGLKKEEEDNKKMDVVKEENE